MFSGGAQSSLLIWASTEAWIVIVVGCVPPIRPLMERVLQRLGLTKKTSNPYNLRGSSGHAVYAYGEGNRFQEEEEDMRWIELTRTRGPNESNEQIVGSKDVVITTNIVTRVEDVDTHGGPSSTNRTISG
ncbi:hypothetical protein N7508_004628 [Penicillium antarcticum]|uniref:uncharacterized protein n=1 Tax=Penicillium antarcticum TaxID=416450 RepID=UPI0023A3F43E|nr:uncharacterized protein N7508_004628 [Penicillium antarcticum]KAJ5309249.1 hypothetical protein N7508_004628 [Penicillium antarcticum]